MREKFRQFMIGRYGTDGLNQFLSMSLLLGQIQHHLQGVATLC